MRFDLLLIIDSLILLLQLGSVVPNSIIADSSFRKFCNRFNGKYSMRTEIIGDRCRASFKILTEDSEEAMNFCKLWLPYHIIEASPSMTSEDRMTTTCLAEAGQVCPYGWNLMRNRCYKLVDDRQHFTWDEAVEKCDKELAGSGIATLRFRMTHIWNAFYPILTQIWLRPGYIHINDHLYFDDLSLPIVNKSIALAYDMSVSYGIPPRKLVRIGKMERSMVICEFVPPPSKQERILIAKKFEKVYYPMGVKESYIAVRGSVHMGRRSKSPITGAYCSKLGKIFSDAFSLYPETRIGTKRYAEGTHDGVKALTYGRTSVCADKTPNKLGDYCFDETDGTRKCVESIHYFVPNSKIGNAIERSTVMIFDANEKLRFKLTPVSDSLRAPLMCVSSFVLPRLSNCPGGFTRYYRDLTVSFCHKAFNKPVTHSQAEKECQTHGAHLTGFESADEIDKLMEIAKAAGIYNEFWVGARRRDECYWGGRRINRVGFDDTSPTCNRNEAFEWKYSVASNEKKDFRPYWILDNPNYQAAAENCLEILQRTPVWTNIAVKRGLNDNHCDVLHPFICGKPDTVIY